MTIITQDGRKLEISRDFHLHISGSIHAAGRLAGKKCKLTVTTFTKIIKYFSNGTAYESGGNVIKRYGVIGEFDTETCLNKTLDALHAAWRNGAPEFVVPIDTGETDKTEAFENFCEKHGLTCVSINELGYNKFDTARNAKIWRTTDEFERRNILVADIDDNYDPNDFGGAYSTSFKKWQALQSKNNTRKVA